MRARHSGSVWVPSESCWDLRKRKLACPIYPEEEEILTGAPAVWSQKTCSGQFDIRIIKDTVRLGFTVLERLSEDLEQYSGPDDVVIDEELCLNKKN